MLPAPEYTRTGFRNTPLVRILGSAISWFLFIACLSLLVQAVFGVGSVGGTCATGNTPYVIAHQCPDVTLWSLPGIFGGLISVALAFWLAQGFGTSLIVLAWPILFGGLGIVFVSSLEIVGYLLGAMFIIMALVPLVLAIRGSVQRIFLGAYNYAGERFAEGPKARPIPYSANYPDSDNPVRPKATDWLLSIVLWLGASVLGFWVSLKLTGGA